MQSGEYPLLLAQTHRRLEQPMTPFRISVITLLTLSSGAGALLAQSGPAVATVVKTEGIVYLNDQPVAQGATPIALGEVGQIRTDAGRAVVSLKRSGALVVGDHASVSVWANGLYNFNKIELLAGSAVFVSAQGSPLVECGTDVRLSSAGVFRFDLETPEPVDGSTRCGFRVYEGAGTTPGPSATYILRAGERMTLNRRAGDMIPVLAFSSADLDDFDRWSRQQAAISVR
jgi:hypothetical protein